MAMHQILKIDERISFLTIGKCRKRIEIFLPALITFVQ